MNDSVEVIKITCGVSAELIELVYQNKHAHK